MTDSVDARALNWRFVLPDAEAAEQLVLASEDETLPGAVTVALAAARRDPAGVAAFLESAITEGPYPSVVVGDLTAWSKALRTRPVPLLTRLADAVRPGGTVFAGFGNRRCPSRPFAAGTLTLKRAGRALDRAGLTVAQQYVAMPDQRCPALLVPVTASGAELTYVLRNIMFPYTDSRSRVKGRLKQILLSTMQHGALAAPPTLRFQLAPAYAVVGVRPVAPPTVTPPTVIPPARAPESSADSP